MQVTRSALFLVEVMLFGWLGVWLAADIAKLTMPWLVLGRIAHIPSKRGFVSSSTLTDPKNAWTHKRVWNSAPVGYSYKMSHFESPPSAQHVSLNINLDTPWQSQQLTFRICKDRFTLPWFGPDTSIVWRIRAIAVPSLRRSQIDET